MAEIKLLSLKLALQRAIHEVDAMSHGAVNIQVFPDYPQWKVTLAALERGEEVKIAH